MSYDFDTPIDRRGTDSYKWEIAEDELPMWVADMDFAAAPEIRAALADRFAHGVFGYNTVPDAFFDAVIDWWRDRHGYTMEPEQLMFCTGVVPAISSTVRKLTAVGDNVLIQSPVYNIFYNSILNNARTVLSSDLVYDGNTYHIDWEDLEAKLALPRTTLMILCNPHNPIGKIWSAAELERIGALCARHGVTVLSDEIHCDVTAPGKSYTPFAAVNECNRQNSVSCIAPTKCFNLAGLQTSCICAPNPELYRLVNRAINTDEVAEPNSFAIPAAIAAFRHGGKWLDELREYVEENKRIAADFLRERLPMLHLVPAEATYLLWIDCARVCPDSVALTEFIRARTGLYLSEGAEYGENGRPFVRMNIACPRTRLQDGLDRFAEGIKLFQQEN